MKRKKTLILPFVLAILSQLIAVRSGAQTAVPFDSPAWEVTGKLAKEIYQGKDCIRLTEGTLYLKDSTFRNGTIEFDIALAKERYFPGLGFRIQDKTNYELFYVRPHQVGNPDAVQYTPVYNGQSGWQFYYGEGYSAAVKYPLEEWFHLKIVVRGTQAEVYVSNPDKPALVIHQLKHEPRAGGILIDNSSTAVTRYANFSYTKQDNPALTGKFLPEAKPAPGTIMNWQVSNPFDEKLLADGFTLPQELVGKLSWARLTAENSGVLNVARITKLGEGSNTVFTRLTLTSDKPQVKRLQFGFSDRVKVYVNGRLVYAGQDVFTSRDYRFLGTVGYFDEVYLDLKKGTNDIWIAVSETFGGWGVKGLIADQTGLTIQNPQ